MRAESLRCGWVLPCIALLLSAGCVTQPVRAHAGGTWAHGPRTPSASWETAGHEPSHGAPSPLVASAAEARLRHRQGPKREQGANASRVDPAEASGEALISCGGDSVPPGWPHLESSEEVLAPFLTCASPAGFVAMQRGVDMPRLVASLKDWDAVRLGALGPLSADAALVLNRKRAAFLVTATEKYGVPLAEVFALFILHSAFDDELRAVLQLLARDKQLGEVLGGMSTVREELKERGLKLSEFPERAEQAGDVLRGLGRAGRDVLSSSQVSAGARYMDLSAKRGQLPPPYQQALDEVEQALMEQHFAPDSVALGSFDHLTFGVPLGFFHLLAGTGRGAYSLTQGRYEQATRELAPAALMVALYAGGKGARSLSETVRNGRGGGRRLQMPALDLEGLKAVVAQLEDRLGVNAARELLRYMQANREGALLAAEWGEAGALALHEARGNPAKAQALLAEASRERPVASSARNGGSTSSLAKEAAGIPREVLEARLAQVELESTGPRLTADVALLKKQHPSREAPPPGAEGHPLWHDYVAYRESRLVELEQATATKGPLRWDGYLDLRGVFARGLQFERLMVSRLRADAARAPAQRQWLKDFNQPRIETHVGVAKADLRFADVLVIEEKPPAGQPPRVETFSFKSRDLTSLKSKELTARMAADANEALGYYGEELNIRRPGLMMKAKVQKVRLVYEGGRLAPSSPQALTAALDRLKIEVEGVEIQFQ
ncbi:hypothetical protein OV208_02440 [Corallococcus sp. bb12-1]|uniref:hypothetical protein n=1 Tax=Corallococcus sp. bb12-1 TaxID=2996784 RepID=UPI00226E89C5|nr:hypothetical protein [Corallococcus sp. bb12-1]MCY1040165.1 hypothetical protein [Corallococcus sp. bb12-1]